MFLNIAFVITTKAFESYVSVTWRSVAKQPIWRKPLGNQSQEDRSRTQKRSILTE